ncbi:hypothetical protein FOL46_000276 [Perkinsus olseni]|uniref:Uncharacterized protein n=1 Tax=Perkinsus olseni TaxID=32597 RepID=A0A7J6KW02_PEROL|nr:hypothetical protein FOL46_000276 [Perkinsus olseni]
MNVRELRLAGVKIMSNVKEDARELVVAAVKNTITEMKNSGKRLLGAVKGDTSVLRVLFKGLATIPMALSKSHKLIERISFHCQQLYGRVNHALSTGAESIAITGLKERFKQIAASILVLRQEISTLVKRDTSSPLLKLTLQDFQRQQAASEADLSKWIMNPPSKTDTLEPLVEEARRGSAIASGDGRASVTSVLRMIDSYTEVINRGQGPEGRAAVEEESIYDERQVAVFVERHGKFFLVGYGMISIILGLVTIFSTLCLTKQPSSSKSSPVHHHHYDDDDRRTTRAHRRLLMQQKKGALRKLKEEERQSLEDDHGGDTNLPLLIAHKHQQHDDLEEGRGGRGINERTTSM